MLLKPSAPSMPSVMLVTFLVSFGAYLLLYLGFMIQRYAMSDLQVLRDKEVMGAA